MFQIAVMSRQPVYEQIISQIEQFVLTGILTSGSQIPSVRSLSVELSINPNTIQKAYQDMEKEGIIYSVAGKGSFVNDIRLLKEKEQETAAENLKTILVQLKRCGTDKAQVLSLVEEIFAEEENL